jgi:aminomethyltransferase
MRTPLFDRHVALGARMVEFAGWEMPVQYTGILDEHHAVRHACGIFDISHMGQLIVRGDGAAACLDSLLTNHTAALGTGRAHYSLLLNERGGVIDDLYVYRTGPAGFLLVVNAAKAAEDVAWIGERLAGGAVFEDVRDHCAALAVQGPGAPELFKRIFGNPLPAERNVVFALPGGGDGWGATTGYTGEAGFEVFAGMDRVVGLWDAFVAAGCVPCGLGARDLLRLEMGYPLNGSDLSPERTPLEAGLGAFVKFDKGEFTGCAALLDQRQRGIPSRLCAIVADGASPPFRPHYPLHHSEAVVGETTSGAFSPVLGRAIAMGYLPAECSAPGTPVACGVRGRLHPATIVKKPIIKTKP